MRGDVVRRINSGYLFLPGNHAQYELVNHAQIFAPWRLAEATGEPAKRVASADRDAHIYEAQAVTL